MKKCSIKQIHSQIRSNLIRLRREKDITQLQLAMGVGCSQSFINQLESGDKEINIEQAYKIATVLDCSIYQLLPEVLLEG